MTNNNNALHWFRVSKAYNNCHDGRTYAQVLAAQATFQTCTQPIHDDKSTRIVAIRRKNANATLVTHPRLLYQVMSLPPLESGIVLKFELHEPRSQKMKILFH